MNAVSTARADITIDNERKANPGTLEIEQEIVSYSTATATRPDPGWTLTDPAGHWHAYDDQGELPTLESKLMHVDCDGVHTGPLSDPEGPCEGYDVTEWTCRICAAQVQPGRLSDAGEKSMPGRKHWHATMVTDETRYDGRTVTVRAATREGTYFGVAVASIERMEHSVGGGYQVTYRLGGIGPLGVRHG